MAVPEPVTEPRPRVTESAQDKTQVVSGDVSDPRLGTGPVASDTKRKVSPDVQRQLNTSDPERVFTTAKPAPGVPALTVVGSSDLRIITGQSVVIRVQAAPHELVSFRATDGGEFPNHAGAITVLADERGIATTTLTAVAGTVDDTQVLAGSPGAVGTVGVMVHVLYPQSPLVTATQHNDN